MSDTQLDPPVATIESVGEYNLSQLNITWREAQEEQAIRPINLYPVHYNDPTVSLIEKHELLTRIKPALVKQLKANAELSYVPDHSIYFATQITTTVRLQSDNPNDFLVTYFVGEGELAHAKITEQEKIQLIQYLNPNENLDDLKTNRIKTILKTGGSSGINLAEYNMVSGGLTPLFNKSKNDTSIMHQSVLLNRPLNFAELFPINDGFVQTRFPFAEIALSPSSSIWLPMFNLKYQRAIFKFIETHNSRLGHNTIGIQTSKFWGDDQYGPVVFGNKC